MDLHAAPTLLQGQGHDGAQSSDKGCGIGDGPSLEDQGLVVEDRKEVLDTGVSVLGHLQITKRWPSYSLQTYPSNPSLLRRVKMRP